MPATPWIVIVVIVIAVIAFGEWREWRGEKRGDAAGYQRALPQLAQVEKRTREEYLGIIRSLQWELQQKQLKQPPVVLQLGDGMELRQKPAPRSTK